MSNITPPPELVQQWNDAWAKTPNCSNDPRQYIATRAAQWGADQELEACCEWLEDWVGNDSYAVPMRAARRPKPPSLKQQALAQLQAIQLDLDSSDIFGANTDTIRRALEQLND